MGQHATVIISESGDVIGSIGKANRLATHLSRLRVDAPSVRTHLVPGLRCDVLSQRMTQGGAELASGTPAALATLSTPLTLNDDALLVVVSLSENLTAEVVRHTASGRLLQLPAGWREQFGDEERSWLDAECEPAPSDVAGTRAAIAALADHASSCDADMLVYNVSTYTPHEAQSWFAPGDPEPAAVHASRLDLMLDKSAGGLGVFVLDVDRLAAEYGAAAALSDSAIYTTEFCDVLADEAVRLIVDMPRVNARFAPDTMALVVPPYDRRTRRGVLERWHVSAPAHIESGDPLFDVRFDHIHSRINGREGLATNRTLRVSVIARRSGYLTTVSPTGEVVDVGDSVGVMAANDGVDVCDTVPVSPFPTDVRLAGT